jgi:hypothetical protein
MYYPIPHRPTGLSETEVAKRHFGCSEVALASRHVLIFEHRSAENRQLSAARVDL